MKSLSIVLFALIASEAASASCINLAYEKYKKAYNMEGALIEHFDDVIESADARSRYNSSEQWKRVGEYTYVVAAAVVTSPIIVTEAVVHFSNESRAERVMDLLGSARDMKDFVTPGSEAFKFAQAVYEKESITGLEALAAIGALNVMNIKEEFCWKKGNRIRLYGPRRMVKMARSKLGLE